MTVWLCVCVHWQLSWVEISEWRDSFTVTQLNSILKLFDFYVFFHGRILNGFVWELVILSQKRLIHDFMKVHWSHTQGQIHLWKKNHYFASDTSLKLKMFS